MPAVSDEAGRIVVGVDGSEASRDALAWAARQAHLTGARLQVIMTWHIPTAAYGAPIPLPTVYDFISDSEHELARVIHEVLGDHPGVDRATARPCWHRPP